MSTVETTNLKNPSSGSNNIVLNTDGTVGGVLGTTLDAKLNIAGGKILQTVFASTTTSVNTTSTSFIDSGLSATITPNSASSKVLVLVSQHVLINRSANVTATMRMQLLRAATVIINGSGEQFGVYENTLVDRGFRGYVVLNILDTPATTSATTYKTQMRCESASSDLFSQYDNALSSMILMEISA